MMSKHSSFINRAGKKVLRNTKRLKVTEKEGEGISEVEKEKQVDSPRNISKMDKNKSEEENELSLFKSILKKPKKNITAYAFFIKEVIYLSPFSFLIFSNTEKEGI